MTLNQLKYAITIADSESMNAAAKRLFISQPSLSEAVKSLEDELEIKLYRRTHRGIVLTPEGAEFIGYARQVTEQYDLIQKRYITKEAEKKRFSVSTQHYTFATRAFIETVKDYGMDEYEFSVNEEKTYEVINDVKNFRSEIGILYINDFNRRIMEKIFHEDDLEFHPLMDCHIYAYMHKNNPLSYKKRVTLEDLEPYPCLSFDQGDYNSFYFAEEVLSTYNYKRLIKSKDRATMLNLMIGLNGYTLCSGIICEDLNGDDYCAVRLDSDETMTIGYLTRRHLRLSEVAVNYVEHLADYKGYVLD